MGYLRTYQIRLKLEDFYTIFLSKNRPNSYSVLPIITDIQIPKLLTTIQKPCV